MKTVNKLSKVPKHKYSTGKIPTSDKHTCIYLKICFYDVKYIDETEGGE